MKRTYREKMKADDLVYFTIIHKQTDLRIAAEHDLSDICNDAVTDLRAQLEGYIKTNPLFGTSLDPIPIEETAPEIAKKMAEAATCADVGPMAAVAGAFSQMLAQKIDDRSANILIENGGDLYIKTDKIRIVSIYAGDNKWKDKLKVVIRPEDSPISICTSSAQFGHSLSFGKADAVTIFSKDAFLADATATAICNKVKNLDDISNAIEAAMAIDGILGVLIILGDKMGACGKIEFA